MTIKNKIVAMNTTYGNALRSLGRNLIYGISHSPPALTFVQADFSLP